MPLPEAASRTAPRVEDEHGPLQAARAAAAQRLEREDDERGLLAAHLAEVEAVMSTPLALGNEAQLLIDGPQTEAAMLRAIAEARRHIDLEFYIVEASGIGERLATLLEAKRDALLHAKTGVIDGVWSSVGSTNLDWRSFVHNYEADLRVLDSRFAKELESLFGLDEEVSHEIAESEWERRGIGHRFREWLARRWEYLL